MTRLRAVVGGLMAVLQLTACATATVMVPPEQRTSLKQKLEGEERFLKLSVFVTPFFGDATRRLLTPVPPDLVRLLENPDGSPITPGPVEATIPTGTVVRIKSLEFPTPLVQTERVLMTPRSQVWVTLDVAGTEKNAPPYVLVLRPQLKDEAEFLAEFERYLIKEDPAPRLQQFSEAVREAIKTKNAVADMPAEALEMAWGYPERRQVGFEGDRKKETWSWAEGKRTAVLLDGRVSALP